MTYSDEEQKLMAQILAKVIDYVGTHAQGNIRVAASASASLLFTFIQIMANVVGIGPTHAFIESVVKHLQMLREAQTPAELEDRLAGAAIGTVHHDGSLEQFKRH
jgi:hypothetical protein